MQYKRSFIILIAFLFGTGLTQNGHAQSKATPVANGTSNIVDFNPAKSVTNQIPQGIQYNLYGPNGELTDSLTSASLINANLVPDKTRTVRGEHWKINNKKYYCIVCDACGNRRVMSCRPE